MCAVNANDRRGGRGQRSRAADTAAERCEDGMLCSEAAGIMLLGPLLKLIFQLLTKTRSKKARRSATNSGLG